MGCCNYALYWRSSAPNKYHVVTAQTEWWQDVPPNLWPLIFTIQKYFSKIKPQHTWLLALENLGFNGDQVLHVMWRLLKGTLQQHDGDIHCSFVSENRLCQDWKKKKKKTLYKSIFLLWVFDGYLPLWESVMGCLISFCWSSHWDPEENVCHAYQ